MRIKIGGDNGRERRELGNKSNLLGFDSTSTEEIGSDPFEFGRKWCVSRSAVQKIYFD
jgi:hypothetical protein